MGQVGCSFGWKTGQLWEFQQGLGDLWGSALVGADGSKDQKFMCLCSHAEWKGYEDASREKFGSV